MTTDALPNLDREQLMEALRETGILDQLRAEAAEISPVNFHSSDEGVDALEKGLGSGGFPKAYWKKRDGTVITGPHPDYTETLLRTYGIKKGYKPLPQYGKLPTPGSQTPCCPHISMRLNQFHVLMANGGAHELSVNQIIDAGWHVKPPTLGPRHGNKTVEFPQLKGIEVESVECEECDKPLYGIKGTQDVVRKLRQHANGAHKMTRRDVNDMLWSIGYYKEEKQRAPRRRRPDAEGSEEVTNGDGD